MLAFAIAALTALQGGAPSQAPLPTEVAEVLPIDVEGLVPLHRVGELLLGGQPTATALRHLRARDVQLVIDLRGADEARGFDEGALLEKLGLRYEIVGFDRPTTLTDGVFQHVRRLVAEHRTRGQGKALLHGAGGARVGALWISIRVLDEGVPWERAVVEARSLGLNSGPLATVARDYVLGAGKQALGATKHRIRAQFPDVARISVAELERRLGQPGSAPILLDIRAEREFAVSHLQGAQRADNAESARAWLGDSPMEREIVVYCSVGQRSAYMAQELARRGYTNVRNLEGSLFEWANTGRPVYRGPELAHSVHPYDKKWGRLLDESLHPQ
ncbi:MAG: rhodanese-related sulfurtransferase [Chlamydiales bacterium]|jgi:rhodanese-related sulfurtransferase